MKNRSFNTLGSQPGNDHAPRLLFPTPTQAKALANSGVGGPAGVRLLAALEELAKAEDMPTFEQVAKLCDRIVTELALIDDPFSDEDAFDLPEEKRPERGGLYDFYFAVERLGDSASAFACLRALIGVFAVVLKNTAELERSPTNITPLEFGLLHQSFAVIIDSLRELVRKTSTEVGA